MTKSWPNRDERENLEIQGFIKQYARLPLCRKLEIVERRERPDYFVKDVATGERFGVELTSVYLTDRSVPDEHLRRMHSFPAYDEAEIGQYRRRLLDAIADKVKKANVGYDLSCPLILSIYANEYRKIYMNEQSEWEQLVRDNEPFFDSCHPFSEIVFWNLPNDMVFGVRPGKGV